MGMSQDLDLHKQSKFLKSLDKLLKFLLVHTQRLTVFDAPTHEQYLEIIVPPRGIFSLNGELEQVLGEKEGI